MSQMKPDWKKIREEFLGLGVQSGTKSYYPELLERIEQLRQSEESLQEILNCLYDALALHDFDGNIIRFNSSFLQLFQLTPEQATGISVAKLTSPQESFEHALELMQRAARGDQDVLFEWKSLRPITGVEFDTEIALRRINWFGKPFIVALIRDISARKAAAKDRERLLREIQRHKDELERMLYVFGHDMRTPLVNIQGFSSELKSQIDELLQRIPQAASPEIAGLVETDIPSSLRFISSSVNKLGLMIHGMLQIGRLGQARLEIKTVNTNILLSSLLESIEWQLKEVKAEIMVGFLPDCKGDAQWISQVFGNLLDNALKYRSSERAPQIRISGKQNKRFCIFTMEDNGRGIRQDQLTRIWELFYRAGTKDGPSGEGLGLTMVRQIVERHGGQITCESEEGKGTTFTLILPAPSPDE